MKTLQKYALNALSIIALTTLAAEASTADRVQHSELICGNRLTGQVLLCSTPAQKDSAESSGDKQVVRVILAPHTPYDQNTPYYSLEHATYRLKDNRIFLGRLNRTDLRVIVGKENPHNNIKVMAYTKLGSRNNAHLSLHQPFNKSESPTLPPGYEPNFKAARVEKVLDGTLAPRWVVKITIPVEKAEPATLKVDEKTEWKAIPAAQQS